MFDSTKIIILKELELLSTGQMSVGIKAYYINVVYIIYWNYGVLKIGCI